MAFPRRLLVPGEEIVVEAHPNWSVLARSTVLAFVVVAGCVAGAVLWTSAPSFVLLGLLAIAVLAVASYGARLAIWRSNLFVITTVRVVYRSGVVRRTGREIRLDRIQDVRYHQTLLERLAGAGSLTIESAGAGGREPFPDIRHPAEMQSLINELIGPGEEEAEEGQHWPVARSSERRGHRSSGRRDRRARRAFDPDAHGLADSGLATPVVPIPAVAPPSSLPPPPGGGGPPAGSSAGLREELRDLERLHEAGVLTDDEFTRKRRQLLGLD